jgi:cupin 2 domain-containing protein
MNLFSAIPADLPAEVFEPLLQAEHLRIERIISRGHTTPAASWYDQPEHEWVLVLQGAGTVTLADGRSHTLRAGDYLNIPAHTRHRVSWTDPAQDTVWLAIHYR